jgi:hypothetical protein
MNEQTDVAEAPETVRVPLMENVVQREKFEFPLFRRVQQAPTWVQQVGHDLASRVLWFVCVLAVLFLAAWWFSRPSPEDVKTLLGADATSEQILTTLRELRREHVNNFRDLFQLVVLSGLVPLFTLLAGYAFGSQEREKREQAAENQEETE